MPRVLFMQNCFVPDENQCARLERSLKSLLAYSTNLAAAKGNNEYHYILAGWIDEAYIERIEGLVSLFTQGTETDKCFTHVSLFRLSENMGKGHSCNMSIAEFSKNVEVDYLFMFDNDIVFEDREDDLIQVLLEQKEELDAVNPKLRYPVIACNFKEHPVHNEGALDFGMQTKHGLMRTSTGNYGCVGGGCWLVAKEHWDAIGGYVTVAVYGLDDGKFYLDTIKRVVDEDVRHAVAVSWDQYVIHPSDTDQTYNLFKADTNVNRIRKMDYDELKIDSEEFWKDRK